MYLKIHENSRGKVVAVCDEGLIGKVFEEKDACLDLDRYRSFYVGDKKSGAEIKKALTSFSSANAVGKESVELLIDMGLVRQEDIMYIKKTPYIQIYRL